MLVFFAAVPLAARERAVLIYPRELGLFRIFYSAHQRLIAAQLGARYDVDVRTQVATAGSLFETDVRGASLLVISGHGSPFAISLDGRDQRTLDSSDRERLRAFFATLAPDATIVLQSCDAGQGFAHIVKEAAGPGRRVIAAKGEIPRDGLVIRSLEPFDVSISCRDEKGDLFDCTVKL